MTIGTWLRASAAVLGSIGSARTWAVPPKYEGPSDPESKIVRPLPAEPPRPPRLDSGMFNNDIDRFIAARWKEFDAAPARVADDWTFIRRVALDIGGVIPPLETIGRFMANRKRVDREEVIDHLLDSDRYADHWTTFWGDWLCEETHSEGAAPFAFRDYIRSSLKANKPYDAWVREMIVGEGDAGAAGLILRQRNRADELTIAVSQVFLGTQLKCAQCHDHPFEPWLQTDFLAMQAFWKGTRLQPIEAPAGDSQTPGGTRRYLTVADGGRPSAEARFITGAASEQTGRRALAELMTRRDNPYFARVAVNRLWAKLMGTGLVNPTDGFTPRNPPSHPELLDWLAVTFVDSGYDLKQIIRLICNSRTYQLETRGGRRGGAPDDLPLFETMQLRRLTAEQLHDSILICCGLYGTGQQWRPAIESRYPAPPGSFLATFGSHDRQTIHERDADGTIPQALELLNGWFLNNAVSGAQHPARGWTRAGDSRETVATKLFLLTLTREPTPYELSTVLGSIKTGNPDENWADVHWALINTREFMFIR